VTALGGVALGTVQTAADATILPAYPLNIADGKDHLNALCDRLATYGKLVRDGSDQAAQAGDASTADLFTEISRATDKRLWFLEAHCQ
jgi:starvation-inducible DNA-binding protein